MRNTFESGLFTAPLREQGNCSSFDVREDARRQIVSVQPAVPSLLVYILFYDFFSEQLARVAFGNVSWARLVKVVPGPFFENRVFVTTLKASQVCCVSSPEP